MVIRIAIRDLGELGELGRAYSAPPRSSHQCFVLVPVKYMFLQYRVNFICTDTSGPECRGMVDPT